jgi:hypothetical protein
VNDSEHDLRDETAPGGDAPAEPDDGTAGLAGLPRRGVDDLNPTAADRIRQFMAESTVRGGASPADVADLYTSSEIVDDEEATAYLDRRFVHGEVPSDWRAFQDQLSAAYLDGPPGATADALVARVRDDEARQRSGRSIFDDPDEDELLDEDQSIRLEGRDPNLVDLGDDARRAIERHIIAEVLCYGVAPYQAMQLREDLRTGGDERALQYLDLPFELGARPDDWDALRDRALMARSRLELMGIDPAGALAEAEASHPGAGAAELLDILLDREQRR